MSRSVRVSRRLPFAIEEVWEALVDPEALREWFCDNDFAPQVGHRFTFRDRPRLGWSGLMECEVLVVEPPTRLSYRFRSDLLRDTVVLFALAPDGESTRITIEHSGFSGFVEFLISSLLRGGWGNMVTRRLPEVLARRRAQRGPVQ